MKKNKQNRVVEYRGPFLPAIFFVIFCLSLSFTSFFSEVSAAGLIPEGFSVATEAIRVHSEHEIVGPYEGPTDHSLTVRPPSISGGQPVEIPLMVPFPEEVRTLKDQAEKGLLNLPPAPDVPQVREQDSAQGSSGALASFSGPQDLRYNPPDTTIAVGPTNLVTGVNRTLTVYNKTGSLLYSAGFADSFFWGSPGTSGLEVMSDPWILYDPHSGRFFILMMGVDENIPKSYLYLAVSKQSDVSVNAGSWCKYRIDATQSDGTDLLWADFPKLGVNPQGVYITANMFKFVYPLKGSTFRWASLWVYPKSQLTSCSSLSGEVFTNLQNAGTPPPGSSTPTQSFDIQPVLTLGNMNTELMVNAHALYGGYSGSGWNGLTYWMVFCCNPTSLLKTIISTSPYSAPPDAKSPYFNSYGETIDTLDGRLANAVYYNNYLWTAHAITSSNIPGYSTVRVHRIDTVYRSDSQQDYGLSGYDYYNPSVIPDLNGSATVVFNRSSLGESVGLRYGRFVSNAWQPSVSWVSGYGSACAATATHPCRWGDYAGSALDPNGSTTWLFGETSSSGYYTTSYDTWIRSVP